jgi:hypothetical protein
MMNESKSENDIALMSSDIVWMIFQYLDFKTLISGAKVCHMWKQIGDYLANNFRFKEKVVNLMLSLTQDQIKWDKYLLNKSNAPENIMDEYLYCQSKRTP